MEWYSRLEKNQKNPLIIFISELENGIILVVSDRGPRLGTIALGVPTLLPHDRINISSMPIVFGIRNDLLTRAIAERVASLCKKIVIVSTHLLNETMELAQRALKFAEASMYEFLAKDREV